MPIIFNCPACGRQLEAGDENAGSPGTCRFCGSTIAAPVAPGEQGVLIRLSVNPPPYAGFRVDQPTGRLDLGGIIGEAWALLKVHWGPLCVAQLASGLMMVVVMLPAFLPFAFWALPNVKPSPNPFQIPPEMIWIEILLMLVSILSQPFAAGSLYVTDRIVASGTVDLGLVLAPFRHYLALLKLALVCYAPALVFLPIACAFRYLSPPAVIVAFVAAMPFAFLFMGLQVAVWQPAMMEVVDRGVDGFAAAKASWEFTKGHRWMIVLVTIIMGILAGLGEYACYVGLFFTMGFAPLGNVLIYRHLRGLQGTQG